MFLPLRRLVAICMFLKTAASSTVRGLNVYGFETPMRDFSCSRVHPIEHYLPQIVQAGFNAIRCPVSVQYIHENAWDAMDHFVALTTAYDLDLTIDMHRVRNDHQTPEMDAEISMQEFIQAWITLARRYAHVPNFSTIDVINECQHGPEYAETHCQKVLQVITAIEKEFPGRFLFYSGGVQWGGSLQGTQECLMNSPYSQSVRFTAHQYSFSGDANENSWNKAYGDPKYYNITSTGEWGFRTRDENNGDDSQEQWARRYISWLKSKNLTNSYFWCFSHSDDTKALWYDDCENLNTRKLEIIQTLWE